MTVMQSQYDQYDQEFLHHIECMELRIPVDETSQKVLGLHARYWRVDDASAVRWIRAIGTATVVSYVEFHRQYAKDFPVPYVVALVELTEGPRLLARLVGIDGNDVSIGMPLKVSFDERGLAFQADLAVTR